MQKERISYDRIHALFIYAFDLFDNIQIRVYYESKRWISMQRPATS